MLNKEQLEAIRYTEGPLLVIAGAGSGKTRTLTHRIAHLIEQGVDPAEILAVTFTNKAAGEMKERIEKLCSVSILASTFHSLSAKILRQAIAPLGFSPSFAIFDEEDSEKVIAQVVGSKDLVKSVKGAISKAKNLLLSPELLLKEDQVIGTFYKSYQDKLKEYNALDFDDLLYQTMMLFQGHPHILEQFQRRWSFILIDEYQDTNHAQYMLTKLLAGLHHNVFAVGDPDQSIYSWRGADIHNILNFEKDYPGAKIIVLEQNYRSQQQILAAANGLIAHNQSRYKKKLWSARAEGEKVHLQICPTDKDEVAFVTQQILKHRQKSLPLSECAILYRTHFQSRLFEDALLKHRIPYQIIGGISFYMRREVKDLLSYLRIASQGSDFLSFVRTINVPKRGIGQVTIEKLRQASEEHRTTIFLLCQRVVDGEIALSLSQKQREALKSYVSVIVALRAMIEAKEPISELLEEILERTNFMDYLDEDPETSSERKENARELVSTAIEWAGERQTSDLVDFLEELSLRSSLDQKTEGDTLRLMTLHNGKGLEFSLCFLVGMEEELFPHINAQDSPEAIEEERRLAYVGMTRAKDFLYLSAAKQRLLWGTVRPMRPSRFLFEIPSETVTQTRKIYDDF